MTHMQIRTAKVEHTVELLEALIGEAMAVQMYKAPETAIKETITMLKYELHRHKKKKVKKHGYT